jgi:rubrerythrin
MHPMTRANLEAALAGEAMAALRYRLFADRAEDDGLDEIEELFESIGCDERREHAREIADALGIVHPTRENLEEALQGDVTEHHRLYPMFAAQARRVGDIDAAELFEALGRSEHIHADEIREAIDRLGRAPVPG